MDVFSLLEKNGWGYDAFYDGYIKGNRFILQTSVYQWAGDVKYYLETGFIRNLKIFDTGNYQPTPQDFGLKCHKDGRAVQIRIVK